MLCHWQQRSAGDLIDLRHPFRQVPTLFGEVQAQLLRYICAGLMTARLASVGHRIRIFDGHRRWTN